MLAEFVVGVVADGAFRWSPRRPRAAARRRADRGRPAGARRRRSGDARARRGQLSALPEGWRSRSPPTLWSASGCRRA